MTARTDDTSGRNDERLGRLRGYAETTARIDSTGVAAVDDAIEWRAMADCPPHRKCLLRNLSGSPCIGTWDGRDTQWTGWSPLPVVPDWMR